MNELLITVGVLVFFISIYGAVLVGGHLLAELDDDAIGGDVAGTWADERSPALTGPPRRP